MSRARTTSVAGRLAVLLCSLATVSTGVALVLQDRALDQDLRLAARERLEVSAAAADQLIGDHLRALANRYAASSRTPEFRANLETGHEETLNFFASRLLRDQGATLVGFLDPEGDLLTSAGDPRLMGLAESLAGARDEPDRSCLRLDEIGPTVELDRGWSECAYPFGGPESSLFESRGELYAGVVIPLRSGQELEGGFVAVEAVDRTQLARWSNLSGATLHLGPGGGTDGDLETQVRAIPGLAIRASTTMAAARATIRRARANIVASGVLALFLALGASLFLARAFARPIVEIREATARLSEGDLDSRVHLHRGDEIGELGEAFNELASRLTDSQERVRRAQRLARFGNWYFDFETRTFEGTAEFRRLFGLELNGPVPAATVIDQVVPNDRTAFQRAMERSRRQSTPFRLDVHVPTEAGSRILQIRGHARNRTATRLEGSVLDVTDRRKAEEQIRYLSRHDPLTGLGNREKAMEELAARTDGRAGGETFALLMIGVDDLQTITDTFGHPVSDQLLVEVAHRLIANLRRGGDDGREWPDIVARLGDERFAAVLDAVHSVDGAAGAAERLLGTVRGTYQVGEHEISVSTSAGVALWPDDGDDADTLLRNAETALTRVQRKQPGGTRFFHESMHTDASRRIRIASRLPRAVEAGKLELFYQPRVRIDGGGLVGFEGLARWTDAELGFVSPGEFIPIAEATGSIGALGDWCIETASARLRDWHASGLGDLCVSVNLSRHQLQPALVERVLSATDGLDRSCLELEVTESALIEEGDSAIETLTALRAHGFRIALDDFGTGYSSLSYLQGLPLDTVKVDRGFIKEIAEDDDAAALAGSVLAMCQALRLHTVAEGVETEEQLAVLRRLGYTEAQGFFFAKPMPDYEAQAYIATAPRAGDRTTA
ncbi:MAG: EAL domain-containing protein [Gemmatimonadetes bacterium]|nr:EAL domain-containing protein [Gemmatimonadota bacterium]